MEQSYVHKAQSSLMRRVLSFFIIALALAFITRFFVHPAGSYLLYAYLALNGSLFIIAIIAFILNEKGFFQSTLYLTLLIAIIGVWGPILINKQTGGIQDVFLLMYLLLPILYSSVVFPLTFTIFYTIAQMGFIIFVVMVSKNLTMLDKTNFIIFMALVSFFSILTNYVNSMKSREFHEESIIDELTGLFNRRYFNVMMKDLVKKSETKHESFGLIIADIDNFKSYNDTYGHPVGDVILREIATCLSQEAGLSNIVCRYGGDEFVILITNPTQVGIFEVAKTLQHKVAEIDYSQVNEHITHITLTMGLSMYPMNGSTFEELIGFADSKLIKAKEEGKNKVAY